MKRLPNIRKSRRGLRNSLLLGAALIPLVWHSSAQNFPVPIARPPEVNLPPVDDQNESHQSDSRLAHIRRERLLSDRLKHLQEDSMHLVELTNRLKTSLQQHPDAPTEADKKLMQNIEKLARDIRKRMVE